MIDLHCHVLPGIDDGPATVEDAIELARVAASEGTRTIVATPHVSARYPNETDHIVALVASLNERIRAEGFDVKIAVGAEIALTQALETAPAALARSALGDGQWLLIEPPFASAAPRAISSMFMAIMEAGHHVVIAHPERCPAFEREPGALVEVVRAGALTSVTAGSLTGQFGAQVRRFAELLFREGLVHNVASDAHDTAQRPPTLARELSRAGLEPLARWLTCDVPEAILTGTSPPPRPELESYGGTATRRRRLWKRRAPAG